MDYMGLYYWGGKEVMKRWDLSLDKNCDREVQLRICAGSGALYKSSFLYLCFFNLPCLPSTIFDTWFGCIMDDLCSAVSISCYRQYFLQWSPLHLLMLSCQAVRSPCAVVPGMVLSAVSFATVGHTFRGDSGSQVQQGSSVMSDICWGRK